MNHLLNFIPVFGASTPLDTIKSLLKWFFGAAAIALIIVGALQIGESMAESNPAQRNRGLMMIMGGLLVGGAAVLVRFITAPPGT